MTWEQDAYDELIAGNWSEGLLWVGKTGTDSPLGAWLYLIMLGIVTTMVYIKTDNLFNAAITIFLLATLGAGAGLLGYLPGEMGGLSFYWLFIGIAVIGIVLPFAYWFVSRE